MSATVRAPRHVARTTPYAWPYDGRLDGQRIAVVVAGAATGWRSCCRDIAATEPALRRLCAAALAAGGLVVTVAHGVPRRGPEPAAAGEPLDIPGAVAATAAGLDAFYGGALEPLLRAAGCDLLLVAGYGLEGPVHSTLRGANDRGLECLLVADASACLDPALRAASASSVIMSGGIFGAVGDTAAVCAALASVHPFDEEHPA